MGNSSTLVHALRTTSFFFFNEDQTSGAKFPWNTDMLLIRQIVEGGRKGGQMQRHSASMSEIKTSQQFSPQVNTKVDDIVTVVSENLSSGPKILDISSLFHYCLHQIDRFFHHSNVKSSLPCNTQFPSCLSHHTKSARSTSTVRNPQHSHKYFISEKLRDAWENTGFSKISMGMSNEYPWN